jgi:hypothetical protein
MGLTASHPSFEILRLGFMAGCALFPGRVVKLSDPTWVLVRAGVAGNAEASVVEDDLYPEQCSSNSMVESVVTLSLSLRLPACSNCRTV